MAGNPRNQTQNLFVCFFLAIYVAVCSMKPIGVAAQCSNHDLVSCVARCVQEMGLIEQDEEGGRMITKEGQRDLDRWSRFSLTPGGGSKDVKT